jgi:hypothetical protein
MTTLTVWRRCSSCKIEIGFSQPYWVCSVSTCTRSRTGFYFCSVPCWEAHLPMMRHREAFAVEMRSPSAASGSRSSGTGGRGRPNRAGRATRPARPGGAAPAAAAPAAPTGGPAAHPDALGRAGWSLGAGAQQREIDILVVVSSSRSTSATAPA